MIEFTAHDQTIAHDLAEGAREGGKRDLEGEAHDASLEGDEDENWNHARHLAATVEDHELLDPTLSPERLLYRLFHEHGVRVFKSSDVEAQCSCSRDSVTNMLKSFSKDDRDHMVEDGVISVTCEFCDTKYVFAPAEVEAAEEG